MRTLLTCLLLLALAVGGWLLVQRQRTSPANAASGQATSSNSSAAQPPEQPSAKPPTSRFRPEPLSESKALTTRAPQQTALPQSAEAGIDEAPIVIAVEKDAALSNWLEDQDTQFAEFTVETDSGKTEEQTSDPDTLEPATTPRASTSDDSRFNFEPTLPTEVESDPAPDAELSGPQLEAASASPADKSASEPPTDGLGDIAGMFRVSTRPPTSNESRTPTAVSLNPFVADDQSRSAELSDDAALPELETADDSISTHDKPTRLPEINDFAEADIVQFAAGAIEFEVPRGWAVTQVLVGRDVRLLVAPPNDNVAEAAERPSFWVGYRAADAGNFAIADVITGRLADIDDRIRPVRPAVLTQIAGRDAWRQQIAWPQDRQTTAQQAEVRAGEYIVIDTDWGLVEFVLQSPPSELSRGQRALDGTLASLTLGRPDSDTGPVAAAVLDAEAVLGTWKAFRSRLKFLGDGRVELTFDRERIRRLDADRSTFRTPAQTLTGRFEAADDLIRITWADESRLNFRWQVDQGTLLLTDHEGRISQLNRVFE